MVYLIIISIIGKYLTGGKITAEGLTPRYKEVSGGAFDSNSARLNFNDTFTGIWLVFGTYFSGMVAQFQAIAVACPNLAVGWTFSLLVYLTNCQLWGGIFLGTITGFIGSERSVAEKEKLDLLKADGKMPQAPTRLWERFWNPNAEVVSGIKRKKLA